MNRFQPLYYWLLLLVVGFVASCGEDESPEPPTVTIQTFAKTIAENPTIGTSLGSLSASTNQGTLVYYLSNQSPTGAMAIDSLTGEITVASASRFDFETNPTLTATSTASVGTVSQSSTVTITLTDVDESVDAVAVDDVTVTMDENPALGQAIGRVTTTSASGPASFALASQTPAGAMAINSSTGELSVADSIQFDYETNPTISAKVVATVGTATDTSTVIINLTDVEDGEVANEGGEPQPEITANNFTADVDENPTNDQVIGTVDASISNDSILTYSLTTQSVNGALAIDPATGELSVGDSTAFDYESRQSITATYQVSYGTVSESATITITVNDDPVDDLVLTADDFTASIDENSASGTSIGTVSTSISNNNALSYRLTSESVVGALAIDASTGELTVADVAAFDYEVNTTITGTYEVSDLVTGVAPVSANITINLNDVLGSWETVGSSGLTSAASFIELVVNNGQPIFTYSNGANYLAQAYDGTNWSSLGGNIAGNIGGTAEGSVHTAVDNNNIYIAYTDPGNSYRGTVKQYDGSNWVALGTNSRFSAGAAIWLRLAFSSGGSPFVVYNQGGTLGTTVKFLNTTNQWDKVPLGGTGGGIVTGNTFGTDIAFQPTTNRPFVAYALAGNGGGNNVQVKLYGGNSIGWLDHGNSLAGGSTSSSGRSNLNIIEFNSSGKAHVLYKNADNRLYMETRDSNNSVAPWIRLGANISNTVTGYDFIMANNVPYVVYTDQVSGKLTLKKWDGSSWQTVSADFADGTSPDLAYDSNTDTVYVAFADTNDSQSVAVLKWKPE
ncbi:cadherin repeat domain-containing protein [Tunicatimonas pelagia]|uniref:cadherin repeat domain-containing protein n=1 Tax=Tunicatimonas pelagia TaxID=931531 RepID=UPI002666002E|nr:cadherin repeat domain-containing protein [Tunicatimonas pelagia]WKN43119.1 cadherin repeat domain-containing protein [Tunicatimonas pelagia]